MNVSFNNFLLLSLFAFLLTINVAALRAQEDIAPETEFRTFTLENVDSREVNRTIHELIVPQTIRISPNERSNSIIVSGEAKEIDFVGDLIKRLDVPPTRQRDDEPTFTTYPFPDQRSLKQGFNLVQSMLAGEPGVKMDIDSTSLNLYLQASQKNHQFAKQLFEEMFQSETSTTSANIHVATYLIVDGKQREDLVHKLKKPNAKIGQVLVNASTKGLLDISQPLVASQVSSLVNSAQQIEQAENEQVARGNGFYDNRSTDDWIELRNDGMLVQISKKRFRLKSRIQIELETKDNDKYSTEISGDIELPIDHPVMLSFSSIGGIDSAVLIVLTSE